MNKSRQLSRKLTPHWLHSAFALTTSVFLAFMFLTGSLLVFAPELDWLSHSEIRVTPQDGDKISWGTVYDVAAQDREDWSIVGIERSESDRFADLVVFRVPGERRDRHLWVDPFQGTIQGETSIFSFKSALLSLHERLFLPTKLGKLIVTAYAIPLTIAVIAGLFLYRRFWTGFFRWPRFSGRSRAWLSDLHRLIAVWSLVFLVPLIVTSTWYLAEHVGLDAPTEPQYRTEARDELLPPEFSGKELDAAVATAVAELPGLHITNILLPRRDTQALVFQGELTANLVRVRANAVAMDPRTLELLGAHQGEDLSLHQRIAEAADPLHFGDWGGLSTRILWGIFGLALTALAVIGIIIHAKRIGARDQANTGAPSRSGLARAWRGMGPFGSGGWLSLALIGIGLALMLRVYVGS